MCVDGCVCLFVYACVLMGVCVCLCMSVCIWVCVCLLVYVYVLYTYVIKQAIQFDQISNFHVRICNLWNAGIFYNNELCSKSNNLYY